MIVTRMQLCSAVSRDRDQTLVTIAITNTGEIKDPKYGNYLYTIHGRKNQLLRSGMIRRWPRLNRTACALLQRVINNAYPKGVKHGA